MGSSLRSINRSELGVPALTPLPHVTTAEMQLYLGCKSIQGVHTLQQPCYLWKVCPKTPQGVDAAADSTKPCLLAVAFSVWGCSNKSSIHSLPLQGGGSLDLRMQLGSFHG